MTTELLQSNVEVEGTTISGTLNDIDDSTIWAPNSWSQLEATGHYLVVKVDGLPEDATATLGLTDEEPFEMDENLNAIFRITNVATQTLTLTVTRGTETVTTEYALTGLTLAS